MIFAEAMRFSLETQFVTIINKITKLLRKTVCRSNDYASSKHFELALLCNVLYEHVHYESVNTNVCLFYLGLFMFVNTYKSNDSHTKQKKRKKRKVKLQTEQQHLMFLTV